MTNEKLITQKEFLEKYGHSDEDFQKTKLTWKDLEEIYQDYEQEKQNMEDAVNSYIRRLIGIDMVHSVWYRIKNSEHLINKIIRKKIKNPELKITKENYLEEITDTIWFRALHLFKQDILDIHPLILKIFDKCFHEIPKFYHSIRDSKKFLQEIEKLGCSMELHTDWYRSMHYLVKIPYLSKYYIAEIQIRTIFEEGWSEINHRHNYPSSTEEQTLQQSLCVLNSLAGSADEMASFIRWLDQELKSKKDKFEETIKDLAEKLSKSDLEKNQCEWMLIQLESLKETNIWSSTSMPWSTSSPIWVSNYWCNTNNIPCSNEDCPNYDPCTWGHCPTCERRKSCQS
jgi:putative GTP pyrophosphokinase